MADERGEVLLEVGPPGTGALPASLLLSMKPSAAGAWDMEIAVDTTLPVQSVLVSPDGAASMVHPLSPTQTPQGHIHYVTVQVALAGPGLIVEVLGPDQQALPGLSTYVRPDRQRSFPLQRLAGSEGGPPASWGPPGAQRWETAVNLVGAWKSELGLVFDFLVDDNGLASRMGATARPSEQQQQAWLAPQQMGLINPSLARLWLPAGTTWVEVTFHGGNGDQIDGYRNVIEIDAMPLVDPLSANIATLRPAPRTGGALLQSGGRYQPGEAGMNAAPSPAGAFAPRPVFAPQHAGPAPGAHENTDPGLAPAMAAPPLPPAVPAGPRQSPLAARLRGGGGGEPPPPSRAPQPAPAPSRPSGQVSAPSRPSGPVPVPQQAGGPRGPVSHSDHGAKTGMAAIRELQHIRRRTGKVRKVGAWPETIGVNGPAMGPEGPLTAKPVLTLVSAESIAGVVRIEVFLDDNGLVASLAAASDGGLVAEVPLARITTFSPSRVKLEVPGSHQEVLLLGRNSYGEVYPNLAGMVDVANQTFKEVSLDRESWEGVITFAAPLSLEDTLCCVCRRDIPVVDSVPLARLSQRDRVALRSEYALTPDARAMCKRCYEDVILSKQWLHLIMMAFTGPNLRLGFQRLVFAYAGALLVLTPVGLDVVRILMTAFAPRLEERLAYALTAGIFSFLTAVLPWPTMVSSMSTGWRTLLRTGRVVGSATFGVPLAVGLVGFAGYQSSIQLPEWLANNFWHMDLHIAVIIGFMVCLMVVIVVQSIADWVYEQRLAAQRKLVQMGHLARLIPRLLNVSDMLEFDRSIDRVLLEGLGCLEYQVFAMNPDARRFRLKRAVGPIRHQVTGMDFKSGDEHVLGVCAQLGRPLTQAEIAQDKTINPAARRAPIPSLACFPIWVRGEVAEIYNISRFRGVGLGGDLPGLMGVLTVVSGRGLTDMLRAAEKAEEEEQMAARPANTRTSQH